MGVHYSHLHVNSAIQKSTLLNQSPFLVVNVLASIMHSTMNTTSMYGGIELALPL